MQLFTSKIAPLRPFLDDDQIGDICINHPGEVWRERFGEGWERVEVPELTMEHLESLSEVTASHSRQYSGDQCPLLSALMPTGERIQIVRQPACAPKQFVAAIRKPTKDLGESELSKLGLFDEVRPERAVEGGGLTNETAPDDLGALGHLKLAMQTQRKMLIAGETGSMKTTISNLCLTYLPLDVRVVTLEDAQELRPPQPNIAHLIAPKGQQGAGAVSMGDLITAAMRLYPTFLGVGEVRDEAVHEYRLALQSGHGGSVTTIHAGEPEQSFERLASLYPADKRGGSLADMIDSFRKLIDIVVQMKVDARGRYVEQIFSVSENRALWKVKRK